MNAENAAEKSKSIREEVKELFGLSWDRFVEWLVIAWLALWWWGGLAENNGLPRKLPLEWTRAVLESLTLAVPEWFSDIPAWLSDPSRSWLAPGFILLAVACQTCSLRRFQNTGLRVVALLALVTAVEAQQQYWPLLQFVWVAAIPAAIAVARGFMPDQRKVDPNTESFSTPSRRSARHPGTASERHRSEGLGRPDLSLCASPRPGTQQRLGRP